MKKSISKRIRVTKKGKVMRRTMGQCHFRAKKRSTQIQRRKVNRQISDLGKKLIKKYI